MAEPMKTYELWRSTADGLRDSFFQAGSEFAYRLLEPDARLIWVTEASSWEEAQQQRYDFMDWGLYRRQEEYIVGKKNSRNDH